MMFLVQPPKRVELARLKIAAEASTQSLQAQVEEIRATAHTLRTEALGEVVKQHPFISVAVAAGGGFMGYRLMKMGSLPLMTFSTLQTIVMHAISTLKS